MSKGHLLQDCFLSELHRSKVPVSVFLVNGIRLHGMIDGFDDHSVQLKNSVSQLIYKHAISTVVPSRVVKLGDMENELQDYNIAEEKLETSDI